MVNRKDAALVRLPQYPFATSTRPRARSAAGDTLARLVAIELLPRHDGGPTDRRAAGGLAASATRMEYAMIVLRAYPSRA